MAVGRHSFVGTTRRAILAGIAAALAPGPLVARAQQRDGTRRIGVLIGGADNPFTRNWAAVLVQALVAVGWHEGSNLRIDWRWGGGDAATSVARYAADLVALSPDMFLVAGSPCVAALRGQTSTIPIVFVNVTDPVGQGFVASLARPGGTITGFSDYDPEVAAKWLQMLTQIMPPVARYVAVLYNPESRDICRPDDAHHREGRPSLSGRDDTGRASSRHCRRRGAHARGRARGARRIVDPVG